MALPVSLSRIIGHRGAASSAPENTVAGLREAKRQGASWVEVDAKLTADRAVILLHDDTLDRTTTGKGAAAAMSLAQFRKLDAGAWYGSAFIGTPVPTLKDTVDALLELGLNCNFELKPCPGRDRETGELVMQELQRLWPRDHEKPLISSFSAESLVAAQQTAPEFPRGILVEEIPENWRLWAEEIEAVSIHCWHKTLTQVGAKAIKDAGYLLVVYTVNEPEDAGRLLSWGVDSLITDAPGPLLGRLLAAGIA